MLNCTTNVTVAARATATYNYESSVARQSWGSQHRGGTVVRSSRHVFYGPGEPDNARWDAGFWGGAPSTKATTSLNVGVVTTARRYVKQPRRLDVAVGCK